MLVTTEKTDSELKTDVLAELKYEPSVKATDIGVQVKDGVVTLIGNVSHYIEKLNAVRATKRVIGVKAIADDLKIHLSDYMNRTDTDIAAAATNRLNWNLSIPKDAVKIVVSDGRLTLEGQVEWYYQKEAAERDIRQLAGVRDVINLITLKPIPVRSNIESDIISAFKRNAILDANKIQVQTDGDRVTLRGKVRSHAERDEADRTAWAASGVNFVDNQIKVDWFWN